MQFQREQGFMLFAEMKPLLEKHYHEISHFKDIEFDPDWEQYALNEINGNLRAFTARDENKKLIGYSIYFVRNNLHYRKSKQAVQDVLYIDPDHRGTGGKFILWCDEQLRSENVQVVYHHVKVAHDFGKLLEKFGYEFVDKIYARRLDF